MYNEVFFSSVPSYLTLKKWMGRGEIAQQLEALGAYIEDLG